MIVHFFYALNLLLLLSCLITFRLKKKEHRFSLSLLQILGVLPLLSGEYIYFFYHLKPELIPLLLFSEAIFTLLWIILAYQLDKMSGATVFKNRFFILSQIFAGTVLIVLTVYFTIYGTTTRLINGSLVFTRHDPIFFYSIFLLASILVAVWSLELFWKSLTTSQRWEYKVLILGACMACGTFGWVSSHRITHHKIVAGHFLLLALFLIFAWIFMGYAIVRHRLLNRKMFISRKIVYTAVAPSVFAAYLIILGILSLVMKTFGFSLPFVLLWFFFFLGIVALGLFITSAKLRRRMHFFISTHFYINKYEYRDEWLALSSQLQGASTETDVINALQQILTKSLYATHLIIWLEDAESGYKPFAVSKKAGVKWGIKKLALNNPLIQYLKTNLCFYIKEKEPDGAWKNVMEQLSDFMTDHNLVLISPLFIGDRIVGLIGLGPEFTGGNYGPDDFDLLTAVGTQAASALLAVQMAEKLAHIREIEVWDKLSAFVLHDLKNAATILSLVRENAPAHIHKPEFQQDMLEAVDDSLGRMAKVQERLSMIKGEITPVWQNLDLGILLKDHCRHMVKKSEIMEINLNCPTGILVHTDPELLRPVLENLLLNALEVGAGGKKTVAKINLLQDDFHGEAVIEITDNGPGIEKSLLPNALFEPFKTTKPKGGGVGLWQGRQLIKSLKGTISAKNIIQGGAQFIIRLPMADVVKTENG